MADGTDSMAGRVARAALARLQRRQAEEAAYGRLLWRLSGLRCYLRVTPGASGPESQLTILSPDAPPLAYAVAGDLQELLA